MFQFTACLLRVAKDCLLVEAMIQLLEKALLAKQGKKIGIKDL